MTRPAARILIAIPAHNEEASIEGLLARVAASAAGSDVIVVDDGSTDDTAAVVARSGVPLVRHLTNLGYGRAVQTALIFAARKGYDVLVTLDADGQHRPEDVPKLLEALRAGDLDMCIASRYVPGHGFRGSAPLGRRVGMHAMSLVVGLLGHRRIRDTTSGFRALRRTVFKPLAHWSCQDFHAEAIVYLARLGYRVGEHPVEMEDRLHGTSMYGTMSALKYPVKTLLMVVLGVLHAALLRRRNGA